MKNVQLKRIMCPGKATSGFLTVNGEITSYTIENTDKLFPEGEYELLLTSTGKTMPGPYKGMAYEVRDVQGRTLIKIHVANRWHELEGCIAPNTSLHTDEPELYGAGSMRATARFMEAMEDENGNLIDSATLIVLEV